MSGRCPAGADKLMLHAHGRNKSHVPDMTKQKITPYRPMKILRSLTLAELISLFFPELNNSFAIQYFALQFSHFRLNLSLQK